MLEIDHITKRYSDVTALDDVSLRVEAGQFVVVQGPSGCGKSTLLMIAGAMTSPTAGAIRIGSDDVYALSTAERSAMRSTRIGFVFQMFHLVPYLSVIENVMLASRSQKASPERASSLLDELGLSERLNHKPTALSTGEQQRTAVARALINEPALVLADEPTGNLDPENAVAVFAALRRYREGGGTVIVATHGTIAYDYADRTVAMRGGRIESTSGDASRA